MTHVFAAVESLVNRLFFYIYFFANDYITHQH